MARFHRFRTGKVPSDVLRRVVFNRLGVTSDRLLQGPGVGEDAAVIDDGNKVLVVATDPITGALSTLPPLPAQRVARRSETIVKQRNPAPR